MKKAIVLTAAAAMIAAPAAMGDVIVVERGPGLGLGIPDDGYDGTRDSMALDRVLVDLDGTIKDVNVTIGMDHTWVGDLTIKLVGPTGQVVTLLSRPGYAEAADDGTGCCGDSSNLSAAFRLTYDDESANDAELMGSTIGGGDFVGDPNNGSPTDYSPNAGAAGGPNLSGFDGTNMNGLWELRIGDGAGGDLGTLDYWSLTIEYNEIPAPGALALLGVAGLARRRRRA